MKLKAAYFLALVLISFTARGVLADDAMVVQSEPIPPLTDVSEPEAAPVAQSENPYLQPTEEKTGEER